MSEVIKDSAIKLFGQTIALPLPPADKGVSDVSLSEHRHSSFATSTSQGSKDESGEDWTGAIEEYESMNPREEKSTSSEISDNENSGKKDDETRVRKADKMIPCPRCNSMDTKFCYYNNYNVNQPRHFCKKCQRYWTSGGTMRNVAVGSGRRKNRNSLLPNYPHIMVPDTLQASQATNGVHLPSFKPNAFLITPPGFPVTFYPATLYWGSDMPLVSPDPPPLSMSSGSVLGKHSRGGAVNLDAERSVLIPKTLRIHDPSEAANTSIWSTLGIKNDKIGLFKAFESKGDRQSNVDHRAMVLQANPAAFCRSLNFHERA